MPWQAEQRPIVPGETSSPQSAQLTCISGTVGVDFAVGVSVGKAIPARKLLNWTFKWLALAPLCGVAAGCLG